MKKICILAAMLAVTLSDAYATSHHGGHRGRNTWATSCVHPRIDKMQPAHLATVAPGSAFSFVI